MGGRRSKGPELVENLEGSEHAKERLEIILATLSGELSVSAACEQLGIKAAMFYRLRTRVLQAGLSGPGAPSSGSSAAAALARASGERAVGAGGRSAGGGTQDRGGSSRDPGDPAGCEAGRGTAASSAAAPPGYRGAQEKKRLSATRVGTQSVTAKTSVGNGGRADHRSSDRSIDGQVGAHRLPGLGTSFAPGTSRGPAVGATRKTVCDSPARRGAGRSMWQSRSDGRAAGNRPTDLARLVLQDRRGQLHARPLGDRAKSHPVATSSKRSSCFISRDRTWVYLL